MGEKVPKKMNLKEIGIEKIILIAIAGIVLLLANFSEWKNAISEKTEKKEEKTVQTDQNGVGRVEVMITLKSSKESVLNKDLSEERQTEQEKNSDTQKTNKNEKRQEETILSDSVGNSAPYVVKELEPEIAGIIISCEGAENKVVAASVLEAAQVLFGVSANHIKVLKMEGAK